MFAIILALIGIGMYIEIEIIEAMPESFGDFIAKHRIVSLCFSLVLSFGLGTFFGAAGVIIFTGATCSTVLIQPYYKARQLGWIRKYRAWREVKHASYERNKELWQRRGQQLVDGVVLIWKIATFPITAIMVILDTIAQFREKLSIRK